MMINWLKLLNYFYNWRQKLAEKTIALFNLPYFRWYLSAALIANLINWLVALLINKKLSQNLVILHYNVNLGINLIGQAEKIYILPLVGFIFIIINFSLLISLSQQKFTVYLLMAAAILSNIFLLAGLASIYLINFK